jgi:hypothetical protein
MTKHRPLALVFQPLLVAQAVIEHLYSNYIQEISSESWID